MARAFDDTSSQYCTIASALVTQPCTLACWFYLPTGSSALTLMSVGDGSVDDILRLLAWPNDMSGNDKKIEASIADNGATANQALTSTTWSFDTWHHAAVVANSSGHLTVYLDGGGATSDTSSTVDMSGSASTSSIARTERVSASKLYLDGYVAEAGWWSAALNSSEIARLAGGSPCSAVRPANLVAYHRLLSGDSSIDYTSNGNDLTETNSPTDAPSHPTITSIAAIRRYHQMMQRRRSA